MILEQLTETAVEIRGADFALVVADVNGDYGESPNPSWVIGYEILGNEEVSHRHAFADAMKVLALEQVNPHDCTFEVSVRNKLPGGGQYYWKSARLFDYEEALNLLSERDSLRLLIPATDCPPDGQAPRRRTEAEAAAALLRDVFDGGYGAGLN